MLKYASLNGQKIPESFIKSITHVVAHNIHRHKPGDSDYKTLQNTKEYINI